MAKRAAAGTLALAVCLTGGLVSAGAANAAAGFTFDTRIAGADRYETSVAASAAAFPTGASSVVITNGLSEVDGLTASYVAGLHSAPILYTSGPTTVSTAVQAEITRLKPTTVYIVGGETVVSKQLEDAMKATYGTTNVIRYGGSDRYETAAKVATSGTTAPAKVIVASGVSFADALVAGPVAYKQKYPILLTAATGVPSYTEAALADLDVDTVNVVGGTSVVTDSTYAAVGGDKRLAGETRQATAAAFAADAITNEGFSAANVALVGNTNANAADALVAAPLAAQNSTPILFVDNAGNTATATYLTNNAAKLTGEGYVFGGTSAVSEAAVTAATTAAQSVTGTVGNIAVTPANAVTLVGLATSVDRTTGDDVSDDRTYSVSGLAADTTYRVTLVNANNVLVAANGSVTFKSSADSASASGFSVDPGTRSAAISVVNGSVIAANNTATAQAVGGNLTFTVDGTTAAETLIPVVYIDGGVGKSSTQGGTSTRLETSATTDGAFAAPTETFGLGGAVSFTPAEAVFGNSTATVAAGAVNTAGDYFTSAAPATYYYDGNDIFRYNGVGVTLEQFEQILAGGGTVTVAYAPESTGVSTFNITAATVPSVSGVTATAAGTEGRNITVSWTAPTNATGVVYDVFRSTDGTLDGTDTRVANDSTALTFSETVSTNGTYTYFVQTQNSTTGVTDAGVASNTVTTPLAADTTAPTATYSAVVTDAGFANEADAGDVIRVIFSESITASSSASLRVLDGADATQSGAEEAFTLTNGGNATFALNTAAVSIGGTNYAAGRILTATLTSKPAPIAVITGGNNTLDLPATITNTAGFADAAGNGLTLTGSDAALNLDTAAPTVASVAGDESDATITLTMDKATSVTNTAAGRAQFVYKGQSPIAISGTGSNVVLTFGAGVVLNSDDLSTLTYTQSATEGARATSLNGKTLVSPVTTGAITVGA